MAKYDVAGAVRGDGNEMCHFVVALVTSLLNADFPPFRNQVRQPPALKQSWEGRGSQPNRPHGRVVQPSHLHLWGCLPGRCAAARMPCQWPKPRIRLRRMRLDAVPTEQRRIRTPRTDPARVSAGIKSQEQECLRRSNDFLHGFTAQVFCFDFANAEYHRPD